MNVTAFCPMPYPLLGIDQQFFFHSNLLFSLMSYSWWYWLSSFLFPLSFRAALPCSWNVSAVDASRPSTYIVTFYVHRLLIPVNIPPTYLLHDFLWGADKLNIEKDKLKFNLMEFHSGDIRYYFCESTTFKVPRSLRILPRLALWKRALFAHLPL